jgi:hypothetical protein
MPDLKPPDNLIRASRLVVRRASMRLGFAVPTCGLRNCLPKQAFPCYRFGM